MANVYLLNLTEDLVTMGNVFSTERGYIYKSAEQYSSKANYAYTKTLLNSNLRVYRETESGRNLTDFSLISRRESFGPDVPTKGPFIEFYSSQGDLISNSYINLLLIDKPPVRTGFFQFYIGAFSFQGLITKQTEYLHYNWERIGTKYGYVEQPVNLGYGIEISINLLYTAKLVDGKYVYTPTELNLFLRNLSGQEEIRSTSTSANPNDYIQKIPGIT